MAINQFSKWRLFEPLHAATTRYIVSRWQIAIGNWPEKPAASPIWAHEYSGLNAISRRRQESSVTPLCGFSRRTLFFTGLARGLRLQGLTHACSVASPLPEGSLPSIIQLSKSFSRNPRVALVTDASRPPLSIKVVNTLAGEPSA